MTSLRRAIRSLAGKGLAEVEPQRIDTGTVSRWTGWPVLRTMPDLALHGARREPVNRRLAHLGEVGPRVLAAVRRCWGSVLSGELSAQIGCYVLDHQGTLLRRGEAEWAELATSQAFLDQPWRG